MAERLTGEGLSSIQAMLVIVGMILVPILVVGVMIIKGQVRKHRKKKAEIRRCGFHQLKPWLGTHCGRETERCYQMIRDPNVMDTWWRLGYEYYIIDVCGGKHASIIHQERKFFTLDKLAWRLATNRSQFDENVVIWAMVEETEKLKYPQTSSASTKPVHPAPSDKYLDRMIVGSSAGTSAVQSS